MDCLHYLKQLDAVRPGSEEHDAPELQSARAHLAECESCAAEFEARQSFDRTVSVLMRDVPVPAGAEVRLLARLAASDATAHPPETVPAAPAEYRAPRRRRLTLLAAAAAVALLAVSLGWYLSSDAGPSMTMNELDEVVRTRLATMTLEEYAALPHFDEGFDGSIDDLRWQVVANTQPRGIDLDGAEGHDAAAYWIGSRSRQPVQGLLLVLPPEFVDPPPDAVSAAGAPRRYGPIRVAWLPTGSSNVHLCVLPEAKDGDLDRLLRAVIHRLTA